MRLCRKAIIVGCQMVIHIKGTAISHFNGKKENKPKPQLMIVSDTLRRVVKYDAWVKARNISSLKNDPSKVTSVKCHNVLYIATKGVPYAK
jgi:hypothetical protein